MCLKYAGTALFLEIFLLSPRELPTGRTFLKMLAQYPQITGVSFATA